MEIDNVVLRDDSLISFQYILGDDRPYVQEITGTIQREAETTNRRRLILVDVYSVDQTKIEITTLKWFWVERIISGSVNNLKKEVRHV